MLISSPALNAGQKPVPAEPYVVKKSPGGPNSGPVVNQLSYAADSKAASINGVISQPKSALTSSLLYQLGVDVDVKTNGSETAPGDSPYTPFK